MKHILHTRVTTYLSAAIAALLCVTLIAPTAAFAFFSDTETGGINSWSAGFLDIELSMNEFEGVITNEPADEVQFDTNVALVSGSIDAKYALSYEFVSGDESVCSALSLNAAHGTTTYSGPLALTDTTPTNDYGLWNSFITVTDGFVAPVDTECTFDLIFSAWLDGVDIQANSGFFDVEKLRITINTQDSGPEGVAHPVVLNEFLPSPHGPLCSDPENDSCDSRDPDFIFDYGNDSADMPQGEWVELYNLSAAAIDLTGWYVVDASGGAGNTIHVDLTHAATTTIPANGFLVVYMNKPILNNTGDTVKLYNPSDVLQDSYAYTSDYDYCYFTPTPGGGNNSVPSGGGIDCTPGATVPDNKSYARIPDGIGAWVDPIPTPGIPNTENDLTKEELALLALGVAVGELNKVQPVVETEEEPVDDETADTENEYANKPEEIVVVDEGITQTESSDDSGDSTNGAGTGSGATPKEDAGTETPTDGTSEEEVVTSDESVETPSEETPVVEEETTPTEETTTSTEEESAPAEEEVVAEEEVPVTEEEEVPAEEPVVEEAPAKEPVDVPAETPVENITETV